MKGVNYSEQLKEFSIGVEKELSTLWDILAKFKNDKGDKLDSDEILNFQYRLVQILNKISQYYYTLSHTKKGLLKQQKKMVYKDFFKQKQELQKLLDFLAFLLVVARSLGDAFVFAFYAFDRDYLNKHLEVPPLSLILPKGIGGIGEIEFVKKFKMLDGNLIIYHGITNILRIGDFTLFNPESGKVSAVGELKCGMPDISTLNMNLTIIGHKSREVNFKKPDKTNNAERQDEPFKYPNIERYEKQVKVMVDSFKYLDKKGIQDEIPSKQFFSKPKFDIMAELAEISSDTIIGYSQVEKGLILARFAYKGDSMFDRFMFYNNDIESLDKDELMKQVAKILEPCIENSLAFGQVHFNANLKIEPQLGSKPIFWNSINIDVLKKIYFGEVIYFTIYNVGRLIEAMKEKGYIYEYNESHKTYGFSKKMPDMNYFVSGVQFFVEMITRNLQDESVVLEAIESVSKSMYSKVKDSRQPGKASMNIMLQ